MRSSSIHVWWACRSPCGVRPVSTGNHDARATSAAGGCPEPGHRAPSNLCEITFPSCRRGSARWHAAQRQVVASLTSLATPRPAGGVSVSPDTAAGHGGSGCPGNAPSAQTRTGMGAPVLPPERGCLAAHHASDLAGVAVGVVGFDSLWELPCQATRAVSVLVVPGWRGHGGPARWRCLAGAVVTCVSAG